LNLFKLKKENKSISFSLSLNNFISLIVNFLTSYEENEKIVTESSVKKSILPSSLNFNSNTKIKSTSKPEAFSKLTLMGLISTANNLIRKLNTENFNSYLNESFFPKIFIDFAWLEKIKIYSNAYLIENEMDKDQNDIYKKDKFNENYNLKNEEKHLKLNKKLDQFLKKLKNFSTLDFIFKIEILENFVDSFYKEFIRLIEIEKINIKEINKIKNNKNIKKKIFDFFIFDEVIESENSKTKQNSKKNIEKSLNEFDIIHMVFDIMYEIYTESALFEKMILQKTQIRTDNLLILDQFLQEAESNSNLINNFTRREANNLNKNRISRGNSSKSFKSPSQIYDEINKLYEENLEIDATIFRDCNIIISVFCILIYI